LTFDHPTDPLAYRYGDGYRRAEEWTETIRVRTDSGMEEREVTFRKSHHGPVVAVRDGRSLAMRVARYEDGGFYQQLHAMARARSLQEFQAAVGMLRHPISNFGYADTDGNIWYVYNSPVPRRSERFDWSRPLDGSDPETEWRGYHTLEELPQVLNPESGWLVNTNTSPFRVTAEGENPDPARYPAYMVGEVGENPVYDTFRDFTTSRLHASRHILSGTDRFTFDEFTRAVSSRRVFQADDDVPALVAEWDRLAEADPRRAEALRPAIEALRRWDRISEMESTAMTLYMHWSLAYRGAPAYWFYNSLEPASTGEWARIQALETAVADLEGDWGTPFVPWGEVSRLQRPVDGTFSDRRPSTPVAGSSGLFGLLHEFNPMPVEGQRPWYGRGGNSYVSVIEFGPEVRARTVLPFGQSADPESPHHDDQAELYGRGELKPVGTSLEEVRAHAVRSYRPGEDR
jgi:acyl-homoserine-lactone acylase